ncbi:hypothetical protein HID58_032787 [Brassica napus]|uniref:Uncharacterized protein n=1 Tax=Brassica napus TaxID=3708 RepID=A0ABQ8BXA8_BRANA|nr:hypothetical protein HID58_032787 [Brassica napus]
MYMHSLCFRSFQKHQWPRVYLFIRKGQCRNCCKKTKAITSILKDDSFGVCNVCLNQFTVQTSQLVQTRITTRIHYPKLETFNSSSNNRKPRCYRELASLFAEIAAAEMKRFKRNPRIDLSKALMTNRGGESIGFNTKPLIKPLQVGRRIEKVTLAVARRGAMNFTELIIVGPETLLISKPMNTLKNKTENAEV